MIDPDKITAFDVETKGKQRQFALQPFRWRTGEAWLTTCAVAYADDADDLGIAAEGLVAPTVEQLRAWLEAVIAADHYVVCWNSTFDVAWLIAMGLRDLVYKVRWLDGMLLRRHAINEPRFRERGRASMGLKQTVAELLPDRAGYDDGIDYEDTSPEGVEKLLTYNLDDARYTLWNARYYISQLTREQLRNALIEARTIPLAAEAKVEGIRIDVAQAQAMGEKCTEQRNIAFVKLKMAHGADVDEKVLASPKKLRHLLFKTWGLPVVNLTDTGEWSTDKQALLTLALQDPRAQLVYDYREGSYLKTKFADGPLESVAYNGDGNSRPDFRIFGTYTGRGTYSSKTGKNAEEVPTGIAIHQWKRDPDYRRIILAPEGYDLLEFDFAGQEFRWMAVESGDPTMLGLCAPGEDAHSYMGAKCTGMTYEQLKRLIEEGDKEAKPKRQLGKVANLSLQYRTSPPTLVTVAAIQHKTKITLEEARVLDATYRTTYRAVPQYWRRQIAKAKAQGYVETLAGRRVYLGTPDTWVYADGNSAKWNHESTAINFPIQGIGADQKYLAMLVLRDALPRYDGRFYLELHDGLFVVVPKDKSERAGHELKHLLSNLPYQRAWGVKLPIAFPVDGKRGPSWGELKEFK